MVTTTSCAFCLDNRVFSEEQILVRGQHAYLVAPLGQLVEGYLAIVPYQCGTSISQELPSTLSEMHELQDLVKLFYQQIYGCKHPIFYEQGRGGGGAKFDQAGGFPFHAHLCSLPIDSHLHEVLDRQFKRHDVNQLSDIGSKVQHEPYIYLSTKDRHCVYLGDCNETRLALENSRLKPHIAQLHKIENDADWRKNPGEDKLKNLLFQFARFQGVKNI